MRPKFELEWYLDKYEPGSRIARSRHDQTQWNVRILIGHFIASLNLQSAKLLEIGAFTGWHTLYYRDCISTPQRAAIYDWQDFRTKAVREETDFEVVNLETQPLPTGDDSFDVVVCNQVFEHLKNIYSPITEIHRVLRSGGFLIISVPNMAALHNRVLFACGRQPTTMAIMDAHVRGFTVQSFTQFLTLNGHFKVRAFKGLGLHPFTSSKLPGALSSLSHTPVWCLEKVDSPLPQWKEVMEKKGSSSNFFPDQTSPLEIWKKETN
jgi:SAM-dependent methyltransferase